MTAIASGSVKPVILSARLLIVGDGYTSQVKEIRFLMEVVEHGT